MNYGLFIVSVLVLLFAFDKKWNRDYPGWNTPEAKPRVPIDYELRWQKFMAGQRRFMKDLEDPGLHPLLLTYDGAPANSMQGTNMKSTTGMEVTEVWDVKNHLPTDYVPDWVMSVPDVSKSVPLFH